jgi:hypothetical protein
LKLLFVPRELGASMAAGNVVLGGRNVMRFTQIVQFVLVLDRYALDMDQGQCGWTAVKLRKSKPRGSKDSSRATKGAIKNFTNRSRYKSTCPTPH